MVDMLNKKINITPRTTKILAEVDYLRGQVAARCDKGVFVPSLQGRAAVVMAYASTSIEGSTLTPLEVEEVARGGRPNKPEFHIQMVKNYLRGIQWVRSRKKAAGISERDILTVHKIIGTAAVEGGPVGQYRRVQVYVGKYTPPTAAGVPALMGRFVKLLNTPWQEYHPVISSALIHLSIASIHPFRDGNGRTARLAAAWELYRRGFDSLHIFTVDDVLLENRSIYYAQLDNARSPDGSSDWIEYIADVTAEGLDRAYKRILQEGGKRKRVGPLSQTQQNLLKLLSSRGPMDVPAMAKSLKISRQGLYKAMNVLLKAELISKEGTRRSRLYSVT